MRILFIGVNPKGTPPINLTKEINTIKDTLNSQPTKKKYKLKVRNASTIAAMRSYLNSYKPNVLHISGHGTEDGTILFEDNEGHPVKVYINQLLDFLKNYNEHLKCVILSACHSLNNIEKFDSTKHFSYGRESSEEIHCIIGMYTAIGNNKAILFSESFYDSLVSDNNFEVSYNKAKNELNLSKEKDLNILGIIINHSIDPHPPPIPPPPPINWKLIILIIVFILVVGYILWVA